MIGKRLGNFEVEEKIGAGGMGEVYRARDTRLDRTVAIKILPPGVASDPRRRERFQREAQALSRLNHAHVCTLYDVGEEGGVDFLVMEHLEGTPLSDRLAAGALSLDEALAVGAQIAEGLDAAHRAGVVHRDLKPANVMLTRSGAKILDFGLAKEGPGEAPAGSAILTRTVDTPGSSLTEEGTILGTLQYMSPEQLHGEPADTRSDLFSFGAMLYEMVSGEAPFAGKSQASVIASILEREPAPLAGSRPELPPALDRLIQRCLRKNPEERLQNARDAMLELRWIAAGGGGETQPAAPAGGRRGLSPVVAVTVALGALAVGVLLGPTLLGDKADSTSEPVPLVRSRIPLPEGHRLAGWASPTVAISDDGTAIAFVTRSDSLPHNVLWVRRLAEERAIQVPGSETAEGPVFSPDGQWVLFATGVSQSAAGINAELRKYSMASGLTQSVCPTRDYFGVDWLDDGTLVWSGQIPGGLWRVPASGGTPDNFLPGFTMDGADTVLPLAWPRAEPGGKGVFVSRLRGDGFSGGSVVDLASGRLHDLGIQATVILPLPGDRLAYVDPEGTLLVTGYDRARRAVDGPGRAVDQGLSRGSAAAGVFDVSRNGTALFARGPLLGSRLSPVRIVRVDPDGTRRTLPVPPGIYGGLLVSPTGDRVAVPQAKRISIFETTSGRRTDLPLGDRLEEAYNGVWSRDGRLLAVSGPSRNSLSVFLVPADGTGAPRLIHQATSEAWPMDFEPGGAALLVSDFELGTDPDDQVYRTLRVPLDGGETTELPYRPYRSRLRISPDGDRIAYLGMAGDEIGVFVQAYPDPGPRITVATGSFRDVFWSGDGSRLFAIDGEGMYEFSVGREPGLSVGPARPGFRGTADLGRIQRDPAAEGGAFALENVPGAGIVTELEIVTGWVQNLP